VFNTYGITNKINNYLPEEPIALYKKEVSLVDKPISMFKNDFYAEDF